MRAGKLRHRILASDRDEFQLLVHELLKALLPGLAQSWRLGERDREGVDIYTFEESTIAIEWSLQCKGFEKQFGDDQVDQCTAEISKYLNVGPKVERYLLVVNRPVLDGAKRTAVEAALTELVRTGKAQRADFLDSEGLLTFLGELAEQRVAEWSEATRERLHADYAERMEKVGYIPQVPFEGRAMTRGPASFILDNIRADLARTPDDRTGKYRQPPRYLLLGSFGFGKTTTLHAIAQDWARGGGHAIYVPAALLPPKAFVHSAGLAEALLRIIAPPDFDAIDEIVRLLRETLRRSLAKSKDWLLLIDGIDEAENWGSHAGLAALWNSIREMALPLVSSVRSELYYLRRDEFDLGDGARPGDRFFYPLTLLDWDARLILEFLDAFAIRQSDTPDPEFARFRALVAADHYEAVYGDIPRRPLFLGMLAEDAWRGAQPERELHRLYGRYLRRKLHHDRFSASATGKVVRSGAVSERLGFAEGVERMLLAMEDIASGMFTQDSEQPLSAHTVSEEAMRAAVNARAAVDPMAEEIALNSLLIPAGRDPANRARLFRFAHQSFQDWLTARRLVQQDHDLYDNRINGATRAFMERMAADLAKGDPLP